LPPPSPPSHTPPPTTHTHTLSLHDALPIYNPNGETHGNRLRAAVPRLVSDYLAALGPSVHLVHVGPARFEGLSLGADRYHWMPRSEEHTSELQSLAYLVCRLLLEKKN